jgi:hypothetical protein
MDLLIAILMYLGYSYNPAQINEMNEANVQDENVKYAEYIIDNRYYSVDDEGVVIDVDVNPEK